MLESEVNHEENQSKDHSSDHNQKGRALKLFPGWPRDLLGERLFRNTFVPMFIKLFFDREGVL